MRAGVVQVLPLVDVAYKGSLELLYPTATNSPAELTVMSLITALADEPFMRAGVVHVLPLEDVAYKGAKSLSNPIATNNPVELTVTAFIKA